MQSHWSLRRFYLFLNRKWFDGQLPLNTTLTWEACQADMWAGCFLNDDGSFHIILDPILRGIHGYMMQVLLHEMVHIQVYLETGRWNKNQKRLHGKHSLWQAKMRQLAARGAFDDLW
jgi:hypothetical protein